MSRPAPPCAPGGVERAPKNSVEYSNNDSSSSTRSSSSRSWWPHSSHFMSPPPGGMGPVQPVSHVTQPHVAQQPHLTQPHVVQQPHVTQPHVVQQPHVAQPHVAQQPHVTQPHVAQRPHASEHPYQNQNPSSGLPSHAFGGLVLPVPTTCKPITATTNLTVSLPGGMVLPVPTACTPPTAATNLPDNLRPAWTPPGHPNPPPNTPHGYLPAMDSTLPSKLSLSYSPLAAMDSTCYTNSSYGQHTLYTAMDSTLSTISTHSSHGQHTNPAPCVRGLPAAPQVPSQVTCTRLAWHEANILVDKQPASSCIADVSCTLGALQHMHHTELPAPALPPTPNPSHYDPSTAPEPLASTHLSPISRPPPVAAVPWDSSAPCTASEPASAGAPAHALAADLFDDMEMEWTHQRKNLLYAAVILTDASREVLLSMMTALHGEERADHMTLLHRPTVRQILALPLGKEVQLEVVGVAADHLTQAAAVKSPAYLPPPLTPCAHITISMASGVSAKEAGKLVAGGLAGANTCYHAVPEQDRFVVTGHVAVRLSDYSTVSSFQELITLGIISLPRRLHEPGLLPLPMGSYWKLTQPSSATPEAGQATKQLTTPGDKAPLNAAAKPRTAANALEVAPKPVPSKAPSPAPVPRPPPVPSLATDTAAFPKLSADPMGKSKGRGGKGNKGISLSEFLTKGVPLPAVRTQGELDDDEFKTWLASNAEATAAGKPGSGGGGGGGGGDHAWAPKPHLAHTSSDQQLPSSCSTPEHRRVNWLKEVPLGARVTVAPLAPLALDCGVGSNLSPPFIYGHVEELLQEEDFFQPLGVLVRLTDDTIGHVVRLLGPDSEAAESDGEGGRGGSEAVAGGVEEAEEVMAEWQQLRAQFGEAIADSVLEDCGGKRAEAMVVLMAQAELSADALFSLIAKTVTKMEVAADAAAAEAIAAVADEEAKPQAPPERHQYYEGGRGREGRGHGGAKAGTAGGGRGGGGGWGATMGRASGAVGASGAPPTASAFAAPLGSGGPPLVSSAWYLSSGASTTAVSAYGIGDTPWKEATTAKEPPTLPPAAPKLAPKPGPIKLLVKPDSLATQAATAGVNIRTAESLSCMLPGYENKAVVAALSTSKGDINEAAARLIASGPPTSAPTPSAASDSEDSSTEGAEDAAAGAKGRRGRGRREMDTNVLAELSALNGLSLDDKITRATEAFRGLDRGLAEYALRECDADLPSTFQYLADSFEALVLPGGGSGSGTRQSGLPALARRVPSYRAVASDLNLNSKVAVATAGAKKLAANSSRRYEASDDEEEAAEKVKVEQRKMKEAQQQREKEQQREEEQQWQSARKARERREARQREDPTGSRLIASLEADKARQVTQVYYAARNVFYSHASLAHDAGDGKRAAEYARRGKEMGELARKYRTAANEKAFRSSNIAIRNEYCMDLHHMFVDEALEMLRRTLTTLAALQSPEGVALKVITGAGRHSVNNIPLIKKGVMAYLKEAGLKHQQDPFNEGVVRVHVGGRS